MNLKTIIFLFLRITGSIQVYLEIEFTLGRLLEMWGAVVAEGTRIHYVNYSTKLRLPVSFFFFFFFFFFSSSSSSSSSFMCSLFPKATFIDYGLARKNK